MLLFFLIQYLIIMEGICFYQKSRFHNFASKNPLDQQLKPNHNRFSKRNSLSKRKLILNFSSSRNLFPISPDIYLNPDKEYTNSKYASRVSHSFLKLKKKKHRLESLQSRLDYLSPISTRPKRFKKLPSLYPQRLVANVKSETKSQYNEVLEILKITSKVERDDVCRPKKIERIYMLNDNSGNFNQETQTEEPGEWNTLRRPALFHNFQLTPKKFIGLAGGLNGVSKTPEPQLHKKSKKIDSQTRIHMKVFEASFDNICK